jgi:hypothetical protein
MNRGHRIADPRLNQWPSAGVFSSVLPSPLCALWPSAGGSVFYFPDRARRSPPDSARTGYHWSGRAQPAAARHLIAPSANDLPLGTSSNPKTKWIMLSEVYRPLWLPPLRQGCRNRRHRCNRRSEYFLKRADVRECGAHHARRWPADP